MTLEFAAGVSGERAIGHHLQTDVCDSQTVGGVVCFAVDMRKDRLCVGGPGLAFETWVSHA
jgi:hypothetical protein